MVRSAAGMERGPMLGTKASVVLSGYSIGVCREHWQWTQYG